MIDLKAIRNNPEILKKALQKRKENFDIEGFLKIDENRRDIIQKVEQLKNKQNVTSKLIPQYKKEGKDVASLMEEMKALSDEIKELDNKVRLLDDEIEKYCYLLS
jgi:seryl-tRNA synthetase